MRRTPRPVAADGKMQGPYCVHCLAPTGGPAAHEYCAEKAAGLHGEPCTGFNSGCRCSNCSHLRTF